MKVSQDIYKMCKQMFSVLEIESFDCLDELVIDNIKEVKCIS
ncbi:MAG: hypothetical protein WC260_01425 [Candidatus Pacearchaeota archaeon]